MTSRCSLVTGGGGFIGAHLVRQLLEQGETVRVLELPEVALPSSVEVVRGSVCDADVVCSAVRLMGWSDFIIWQVTQICGRKISVTLGELIMKGFVRFSAKRQKRILK